MPMATTIRFRYVTPLSPNWLREGWFLRRAYRRFRLRTGIYRVHYSGAFESGSEWGTLKKRRQQAVYWYNHYAQQSGYTVTLCLHSGAELRALPLALIEEVATL